MVQSDEGGARALRGPRIRARVYRAPHRANGGMAAFSADAGRLDAADFPLAHRARAGRACGPYRLRGVEGTQPFTGESPPQSTLRGARSGLASGTVQCGRA